MLKELRKKFVDKIIHSQERDKFIPLNDMFSYGRSGNTLHMHLVSKDLRNTQNELGEEKFNELIKSKLEDFLCRLQPIVRNDESIEGLFAVSPIFFHANWKNIHEEIGFDSIKEVLLEDESSDMPYKQRIMFLQMFNKDGKNNRRVFYTNMNREKLLNTKFRRLETTQEKTKID